MIRVVRDADGELVEVLEPGADGVRIHQRVDASTPRCLGEPDSDALGAAGRCGAGARGGPGRGRGLGADAGQDDRSGDRAAARRAAGRDPHELTEIEAFLQWLADDHFTFLGYREYELGGEDPAELRAVPGTGLGILRGASKPPSKQLDDKALELARSPHPLVLTKANSRATVHRPLLSGLRGGQALGADGEVIGERRFLGLYTTVAYKTSPRDIPLLRGKVERSWPVPGFPPDSHDAKGLIDILESLPRDLLVPDRHRRPVRDRDRDPWPGRAPARAAVRVARPARPLRLLHPVPAARPLQHREPRAGRQDPGRRVRRATSSTGACSSPSRSSSASTTSIHCPGGVATDYDVAADRGADRAGDARLERRSAGGADHRVRRGARA